MDDQQLSAKISELLWQEDVLGVGAGIDAPKDEFATEADEIARALASSKDAEQFTNALVEILNRAFAPVPPLDLDDTSELAQKLFALRRNE